MEIAHARQRVGLLVGAIEQLGVVPSAAAAFFYVRKLYVDKEVASLTLTLIFAAVAGLYVLAPVFMMATQRLERLVLVLARAAEEQHSATSLSQQ